MIPIIHTNKQTQIHKHVHPHNKSKNFFSKHRQNPKVRNEREERGGEEGLRSVLFGPDFPSLSPNTQTHGSLFLSTPPFSSFHQVQKTLISTSPGPNNADLHPSSPPLSSLSFLTSRFCLCLEKKFLDLLCG